MCGNRTHVEHRAAGNLAYLSQENIRVRRDLKRINLMGRPLSRFLYSSNVMPMLPTS